jgi:hypothetical protein
MVDFRAAEPVPVQWVVGTPVLAQRAMELMVV